MSTVPGPQGFSFCEVISEAKRIIRAHKRHFFALSLLFLFPLYFSSFIYLDGFHPRQWLLDPTGHRTQPILLPLLFNLFALCFTPCAVGTITYSTFNGFYGTPVTLASSIKSLLYSFLPLLSTLIVYQTIVCFIGMVFGVLAFLVLTGLQSLSLEVNYFWVLVILFVLLLVPISLWLQVNWSLAYVIVVVESKWGYEPLRRSAELVKGMRGVALFISLYYGLVSLFTVVVMLGAPSGHWSWTVVVLYSILGAQVMLHALAANVVLYIYCKALHGEVTLFEIAEEYVSLPFDNAKVSEVLV